MFNQVQNVVKRTSDEVSGGMSSATGGTGVSEGSVGRNETMKKLIHASVITYSLAR